ncbi:MAG TPA: EVE domain-containing protein [Thermoanaerobaculia bacterium]|nr:EVE domain-containing protein [Thermoanaerobaculia bacterium]
MRYWINTVSREHVQRGVAGGFTQADHGDDKRLRRLASGDAIVFYSPRAAMQAGEKVQSFTAIGTIADDAPVQVDVSPDFRPWRRAVAFKPCSETPIQPLLEQLDFIRDKKQWGFPFRRGLFEIAESDFRTIERAMCG